VRTEELNWCNDEKMVSRGPENGPIYSFRLRLYSPLKWTKENNFDAVDNSKILVMAFSLK